MTLKQLKYVTAIAENGTLSGAAQELFISQPSLSKAVSELEEEMGIVIFDRSNRGVALSAQGKIFLGYARQVIEQAQLLEEKYKRAEVAKREFSVSTQHYSFAVNAFVDVINEFGRDKYDFCLRETETYEIIDDVANMRSEIGIIFLNDFNGAVLKKILATKELVFEELYVAEPHVFVSSKNPLSKKKSVTFEELLPYPYLSFEQGEHNSFYFSEEIFSTTLRPKNIRVRDRATLFNLLIGLNGYTVSSGIIDEELNGSDIVSIPLVTDISENSSTMHIGIIRHDRASLGLMAQYYVEALKKYLKQ